MKRREFLIGVGGVAAWPLAGRAQQAMPVIGYLSGRSLADAAHLLAAFRQGLSELGYVEGRNVAIDFRWADGQPERSSELAADLVRRQVAVIFATGSGEALAAKAATTRIPIVYTGGSDPVSLDLVVSLNRPEGNVTGVTRIGHALGAKRLDLLHQLVPNAAVMAILVHPSNPSTDGEVKDHEAAARALGLQSLVLTASSDADFDAAFATVVQRPASALVVAGGPFLSSRRDRLIALAARHAVPATYSQREFVEAGGLMSYGASVSDSYRQAGIYVGRILKGEKPADLPVMQPTKFELVINLKSAKALGLTVPLSLQVAADEVIE